MHTVPVPAGVHAGPRLHHQHVQREHSAHGAELHSDVPTRAVRAADGHDAVPVWIVCGDAVFKLQSMRLFDGVHADELRDQRMRSADGERSDVQRDVRADWYATRVLRGGSWVDHVF